MMNALIAPRFSLLFFIPILKLFANVLGHRLEGGLSPTRSHMRKWMNAD